VVCRPPQLVTRDFEPKPEFFQKIRRVKVFSRFCCSPFALRVLYFDLTAYAVFHRKTHSMAKLLSRFVYLHLPTNFTRQRTLGCTHTLSGDLTPTRPLFYYYPQPILQAMPHVGSRHACCYYRQSIIFPGVNIRPQYDNTYICTMWLLINIA